MKANAVRRTSQSPTDQSASAAGIEFPPLFAQRPLAAVVRLALPTTGVMLVAAASNILFTYYVSRLGPEAIAAVSLVFPLSLIALTSLGGGVGTGTASAVARSIGAGQLHEAALTAIHATALSLFLGLGFAALVYGWADQLFALLGGRGVVLEQAVLFARWLFAGSAVGFASQVIDSVFRAQANVRTPALWSTVSLGLQAALTPVFLFAFRLGLPGAALGMIAAQGLTLLPRIVHFARGAGPLFVATVRLRWSYRYVHEILRVGLPASLSTTIHYTGLMVLTGVVARFGDASLAAYGLATRLDFLLVSVAFGFASGVLTLVGFVTGAGQASRAWLYVRSAGLCVGVVFAGLGTLLFLWPDLWFGLFTREAKILETGALYLRWVAPSYPFVGASMILAFAFQGLGRASVPMLWNLARASSVVFITSLGVRYLQWSENGVFAAIAVANTVSALALACLFRIVLRAYQPSR